MLALDSSPPYIRTRGPFREPTELGAKYVHHAFINVVPFDETKPTQLSMSGRYGQALPVLMVTFLCGLSYIGHHFFI
jgi:hypothetical protein